jgi:hypothetical protein
VVEARDRSRSGEAERRWCSARGRRRKSCRFDDVGGVKIRLADLQVDDVAPGGFQ